MSGIALVDCCPTSLDCDVREPHDWFTVKGYLPDPARPLDYDMGVLIYADTGNPVYGYPYTPITEDRTCCRRCGRNKDE